jgi:glycosyltransferase involved in cell wall biosynthesis
MTEPTIGVAIPCYKGHIPALERLFKSIQEQTLQPNMVVVSCSSSTDDDVKHLYDKYPFPLKIITTETRQNTAINRNIAGKQLKTDIISFFDADDIMHPDRLLVLVSMYSQNHPTIVAPDIPGFGLLLLHNYSSGETTNFQPLESADIGISGPGIPMNDREHSAFAHCAVSRCIFEEQQFPESIIFERCEDRAYVTILSVTNRVMRVYIHNRLSHYMPSFSWTTTLKKN